MNIIDKVTVVRTSDYTKNISSFIFTPGIMSTPEKSNSSKKASENNYSSPNKKNLEASKSHPNIKSVKSYN